MFEQLDDREERPRVSLAMTLGILAAYAVGVFGGMCVFIILGKRPFGIQIATAITYTYFAFWYVFFPTRGLLDKYSLRNKMVQGRIPLLVTIHFAFLIPIFVGETILFSMTPYLPSYWVICSVTVVFFTQVLISRRILSRSLSEGLNKSHNVPSSIDKM